MLTVQLPTLLALLGTALLAIVMFAPKASGTPVTASCAPPSAPPAFERWTPPAEPGEAPEPSAPTWPGLIDASAVACDTLARIALIDALDALRTPWADTILRRALRDDPDPAVQQRAAAALERYPALA